MTSIREHKIDLIIISQVSIPIPSALTHVSMFKANLFIFFKIFKLVKLRIFVFITFYWVTNVVSNSVWVVWRQTSKFVSQKCRAERQQRPLFVKTAVKTHFLSNCQNWNKDSCPKTKHNCHQKHSKLDFKLKILLKSLEKIHPNCFDSKNCFDDSCRESVESRTPTRVAA